MINEVSNFGYVILSFFSVLVTPPVHSEGSKIFLDVRYLNSTFLSRWGAVSSMCVQLNHAHSYNDAVESGYVYIILIVHQGM